ncbi:uncharacterized protein LOC121388053 [Gigantopelta aegis]|uniref:uncharacterized protein LOC121388053 n=1 Tax=Gigantopelta aegis TaxID=1735272 RepID=UPI001B88CB56|nr:uncharacterized protein LOC121388053 [Gigantopelta aegis]
MPESRSAESVLMMETDQSDSEFNLPSWSKGAYLTCSEEEMLTTSLPVYDPAKFARAGSPLLVLTDFPLLCNQDEIDEEAVQTLPTRHTRDCRTHRTLLMLVSFLGIAMLVIGFLSYVHV